MATIDWAIVAGFLVAMMVIGMLFSRRAGGSMADFFISGRSLPWWLAGTSILATSFACDTPLHVTKIIREHGLSGAWFYWSGILFGPMVAFLFARLWRRAAIVTDVEFLELRYSGRAAVLLRCFMALFRSFGMAALTLGWVILGMVKIVGALMDLPPLVELPILGASVSPELLVVVLLMSIALVYTAASGLWGVVTTDLIEFVIALGGAFFLAAAAMHAVGGLTGLEQGLARLPYPGPEALDILPRFNARGLPLGTFAIYVCVLGWAGAEVDGSGNKAQRFLACKDERHSLASGIWSLAVQNIIRSWPWFIAALCSLVLYPELADNETAYPRMIADLLPVGVKGLMVAAFLAAFLSTVDTHLNLGASYLTNDLYRRFAYKTGSDRHYVLAARLGILIMAAASALIAMNLGSVLGALKLKGEMMAGLGLVCILRWYWWRVNPWSEITALVVSVGTCVVLHTTGIGVSAMGSFLGIDVEGGGDPFPARLLIIVLVSSAAWVAVTFLTRPVPKEQLLSFYRRVRPAGVLWGPIAKLAGPIEQDQGFLSSVMDWILCSVFIFCAMIGLGKLLLGSPIAGLLCLAVSAVSGVVLYRRVFGGGRGIFV